MGVVAMCQGMCPHARSCVWKCTRCETLDCACHCANARRARIVRRHLAISHVEAKNWQ